MDHDQESIVLMTDEGEELTLYLIEQTRIAGIDYILAADTPEGDGECMILKDTSAPEDMEAILEIVTDDKEIHYLLGIFSELLEDVDIEHF